MKSGILLAFSISCLAQIAQPEKLEVYVSDSNSWEASGGLVLQTERVRDTSLPELDLKLSKSSRLLENAAQA